MDAPPRYATKNIELCAKDEEISALRKIIALYESRIEAPEGLPPLIVMQLEELTGKIDMVIEILKRIEGRLIRLSEEPEPEKEAPGPGNFADRRAKL